MKDFAIFILIVIVLSILMFIFGCRSTATRPPIIDNPRDALIQTVIKTDWITTIALIGMAVAVAALVNGSKMAFPALAGCGFALWANLTVIRYAAVLAWFGLAASVLVFIWVVFVKNRALKEVVSGVHGYINDTKELGIKSYLRSNQSKSTEEIVKKIKPKEKTND